ncbi:fatty-acid amide hydrolase 2-B-like isoform X2 [Bolinopsis microptera]|uniref:fatty-acid amide hydrolase 2-B-like isoform X2 n=1 Tax=Bolinopsis microptera TaxID=2820187 RepID=UPI00307A21D9
MAKIRNLQSSFLPERVIPYWNKLPSDVKNSVSMASESPARSHVKLPMSWFRQIIVLSIMYVIVVNKLLRGFVYIALEWFVGCFAPKKPIKEFPAIRSPFLKMPATTLEQLIRRRQITSTQLVELYIDRIVDVNPLVNAVVQTAFAKALDEANRIDELMKSDSFETDPRFTVEKMPFLGVPITCKEIIFVKGFSATAGLKGRIGHVCKEDAEVVKYMRASGAIIIGLTNTSELAMWWESHNPVYGYTCNPYDLRCIVGGSSGGEAASVASACSVMGIGSDIGGSIRMPAFFNGVFGHKPSPFLVPNKGQFPGATVESAKYLGLGPICRYAQDLEPMLKCMALKDGPVDFEQPLNYDMSKIKFISVEDDGWSQFDGWSVFTSPVDRELKLAQRRVVNFLESSCGAKVEKKEIMLLRYSLPSGWQLLTTTGILNSLNSALPQRTTPRSRVMIWPLKNMYKEMLKKCVGMSDHTFYVIITGMMERIPMAKASIDQLLAMGQELRDFIHELLEGDTVLLYPSHPMTAPRHHMPCFTGFNFAYTGIWNIIGVPVTQVPLGLDKNGLPLGVQVIGGVNQDRLTIAVARELEKAFGGWVDPTEKYKVYKYEPIRGMPSSPRHHNNSTSSQSNPVTTDSSSPVDR